LFVVPKIVRKEKKERSDLLRSGDGREPGARFAGRREKKGGEKRSPEGGRDKARRSSKFAHKSSAPVTTPVESHRSEDRKEGGEPRDHSPTGKNHNVPAYWVAGLRGAEGGVGRASVLCHRHSYAGLLFASRGKRKRGGMTDEKFRAALKKEELERFQRPVREGKKREGREV